MGRKKITLETPGDSESMLTVDEKGYLCVHKGQKSKLKAISDIKPGDKICFDYVLGLKTHIGKTSPIKSIENL